jgi:hypothetical protein
LKDNEQHRTLAMLKNIILLANSSENPPTCLAVSRASDLCDDLEDDMQIFDDEPIEFVTGENKIKGKRKKKSYW